MAKELQRAFVLYDIMSAYRDFARMIETRIDVESCVLLDEEVQDAIKRDVESIAETVTLMRKKVEQIKNSFNPFS